MVSIHKVPVIVYLIIRAISSIFRFKREVLHCRSLHVLRLVGIALSVETSNAEPHADMFIYITPQITPMLPLVQKEYTNG